MKKRHYFLILLSICVVNATTAWADVNAEITFTNFSHADLYVELAVSDHSGWTYYDLYVLENSTSIANFWIDTIFATYSACAYGELTGDFYGCIAGDLGDGFQHIYFDSSGVPYRSYPPDLSTADVFVFDNPRIATDVLVVATGGRSHGGGCFIGALQISK